MTRTDLAEPELASIAGRAVRRDRVDAEVRAWAGGFAHTAEIVALLGGEVPVGPVHGARLGR